VRRFEHAGIARSVAMKLTGHKTENVYRRNAIVSDQELRRCTYVGKTSTAPEKIVCVDEP
jgi:hypothetical protein